MTTRNHTRAALATKIQHRQLTVKSSYYSYQANQLRHQRSEITEIVLKGKWLAQAGFQAGESITVRVMQGCLVVTKKE
jgi:hypothetical protein